MIAFPFDRLPQEIKGQIYEDAVNAVEPRVVELTEHLVEKPDSSGAWPRWEICLKSTCSIPNVLHLCSQTRRIALKRWRLSFGNCKKFRTYDDLTPRVYFDFSRDILWFDHVSAGLSNFENNISETERNQIQHLAIEIRYLVSRHDCNFDDYDSDRYLMVSHIADYYNGLKTMKFIGTNPMDKWNDATSLSSPNPRNTVIRLKNPGFQSTRHFEKCYELSLRGFVRRYEEKKKELPDVRYVDYERIDPRSLAPRNFSHCEIQGREVRFQ